MASILNAQDKSSFLKIAIIILMILLFLIPQFMVSELVYERENRAEKITSEVTNGAGGQLVFTGPLMSIPYIVTSRDLQGLAIRETKQMYVLPENIDIVGNLKAEYRYRGIYKVPVYLIDIQIAGKASMPPASIFPDDAQILTDQIRLIVGIRNMDGIREAKTLQWQGQSYRFRPDAKNPSIEFGLTTDYLPLPQDASPVDFSWNMKIAGGQKLSFLPMGKNSHLKLSGDWGTPSFQGPRLPVERAVDSESGRFTASWDIPEVSRPIPPHWEAGTELSLDLNQPMMTVELLESINTYARIRRTIKYSALFLIIPFVVFLIFELSGKLKVHPMQYLLASSGNAMFYLLLLGISEKLGFVGAYVIAAGGVTLLLGFYTWNMSQKKIVRLTMPLVLAVIYTWLWVTLQSEDYALLLGAVGIFGLIAVTMFLTRKIDWYKDSSVKD